jgi:hypothetical protein
MGCGGFKEANESLNILRRGCRPELLSKRASISRRKRRSPILFFSSANNASSFLSCRWILANSVVLINFRALPDRFVLMND